jgi:hypothetical protein
VDREETTLTCDALFGPMVDADAVVGTIQDLCFGRTAVKHPLLGSILSGHGKVSQTIPLTALLC